MRIPLIAAMCASALFAAERPNIVFIFSDDHATAAISAYGGFLKEAAPTPRLDSLAEQGAIFTRSYCGNSICGPSRASIVTGKHSHINGYLDNNFSTFDGTQTTFPKLLQGAGYQTAIVGKWHLVTDPTGFDHWEVLPGQGAYYNPDFKTAEGATRYEGYTTDIITDLAIEWLDEQRDPDKPFVLMCQHKAPHRNWAPAERHLTLFDDVEMPEPDSLFDDYADRSVALQEQEMSIDRDMHWEHDMKFKGENLFPEHFVSGMGNEAYRRMTVEQKAAWDAAYEPKNQAFIEDMKAGKLSDKEITRWKYQRYIKDYLRCIRAVDENVGRLIDHLDESGLSENTIVIYSSDQGFYLGEHGWYDKRWMFEESLEMPFLVRWPGVIEPGSRSDALIQNIDYAPTFLELAGVEIPETIQGRSLVPVLEASGEAPDDWREAIYYFYSGEITHAVAKHDGVRNDRYKLMHFPATDAWKPEVLERAKRNNPDFKAREAEWNLFDLEKDPEELDSKHDDPGYAEVFEEMKELYHELRDHYRVSEATVPEDRKHVDWWAERHEEKLAEAKGGDHELVFLGDSITQGWEKEGSAVWDEFFGDREALNLGFSGDRTEHLLWRLLNGEIWDVDAKAFVLLIGTNNTGHRQDPPEKTAEGIKLVLELLRDRQPDAEILMLSVFPRGREPDDPLRELNEQLNSRIKSFADGETIHWLDLSDAFLAEDGTLSEDVMPDALHLSEKGYRIWAEAMEPKLAELLGEE